jgi:hypothetical protein
MMLDTGSSRQRSATLRIRHEGTAGLRSATDQEINGMAVDVVFVTDAASRDDHAKPPNPPNIKTRPGEIQLQSDFGSMLPALNSAALGLSEIYADVWVL